MDILKDGVILCKLANKLVPSSSIRFKASKMPFIQMENISSFLQVAREMGIPQYELFQTVDLYEAKNPAQVLQTLYSFSRHVAKQDNSVPLLGPRLTAPSQSSPGRRSKEGVDIPAWNTRQYGYMGGASQGTEKIVYGKRRDIVHKGE